MNKKSIIIGAIALILGGLTIATPALAYKGDPNVKGPNYTAERHEAMTKAFANNDYNAWKKLMTGKGRVTQVINKDNFAKFAQAHKVGPEEAKKIRAELGLGLGNGSGKGQGMGYGRNTK